MAMMPFSPLYTYASEKQNYPGDLAGLWNGQSISSLRGIAWGSWVALNWLYLSICYLECSLPSVLYYQPHGQFLS
jgi:hypothetical protein